MDLIWDDGQESGQRENTTEDNDVAKLFDKFFVEEEDIWIVRHHLEVAVNLVAQGIFDDFIATLRILSLWNQITQGILLVHIVRIFVGVTFFDI